MTGVQTCALPIYEYVWSLEKGALSKRSTVDAPAKPEPAENSPSVSSHTHQSKEQKKKFEKDLRQAERVLTELDQELQNLQLRLTSLNEKISSGSGTGLKDLLAELTEVQKKIETAEASWLLNSERKEAAEKALQLKK